MHTKMWTCQLFYCFGKLPHTRAGVKSPHRYNNAVKTLFLHLFPHFCFIGALACCCVFLDHGDGGPCRSPLYRPLIDMLISCRSCERGAYIDLFFFLLFFSYCNAALRPLIYLYQQSCDCNALPCFICGVNANQSCPAGNCSCTSPSLFSGPTCTRMILIDSASRFIRAKSYSVCRIEFNLECSSNSSCIAPEYCDRTPRVGNFVRLAWLFHYITLR